MPKPRSIVLLALVAANGLAACGERAKHTGSQPAPPDVSARESTTTAPDTATPPAAHAPSPFPADRDTTRLKATVAAGGAPACGSRASPITADSIGPFRPGMTVAELARRCPGLLFGWMGISDGIPVATVAARVGGATVTAFASDSSADAVVNRVELSSRGPRTREGFGVGSTLGEMQRVYGAPQASESDCVLMVWFDTRPGLNFHLEYPPQERRDCGALSEPPLPPDLRVASVIIVAR
jgi:hypothetical protein